VEKQNDSVCKKHYLKNPDKLEADQLTIYKNNKKDLNPRPPDYIFSGLPTKPRLVLMGLFTDTAATLNSVVSNIYYGMLRGQAHD